MHGPGCEIDSMHWQGPIIERDHGHMAARGCCNDGLIAPTEAIDGPAGRGSMDPLASSKSLLSATFGSILLTRSRKLAGILI